MVPKGHAYRVPPLPAQLQTTVELTGLVVAGSAVVIEVDTAGLVITGNSGSLSTRGFELGFAPGGHAGNLGNSIGFLTVLVDCLGGGGGAIASAVLTLSKPTFVAASSALSCGVLSRTLVNMTAPRMKGFDFMTLYLRSLVV
jgi:hypothetical protein